MALTRVYGVMSDAGYVATCPNCKHDCVTIIDDDIERTRQYFERVIQSLCLSCKGWFQTQIEPPGSPKRDPKTQS